MNAFAQLPAQQAQRYRDKVAIRFADRSLSYEQLAAQVQAQAAALAQRGVRTGDRVAYLGWNSPEQISLLFACAVVGAIFVPLNTRLTVSEWRAVLADCSPKLLAHTGSFEPQAHQLAHAACEAQQDPGGQRGGVQ
jgi:fatty-acyl-CoA synthase